MLIIGEVILLAELSVYKNFQFSQVIFSMKHVVSVLIMHFLRIIKFVV